MKLWLDDVREAPKDWVRAYTARDMIDLLEIYEDAVDEISLDHDLGNEEFGTGYDVMLWIEERVSTDSGYQIPKINFHTSNPVGRARMQMSLDAIKKNFK